MSRKSQTGSAMQSVPCGPHGNKGGRAVSPEQVAAVFRDIRQQKYLIHMIPNTVSAALCADGLAALGARPLMAVAPEEMAEIAAQADGCVVNLGQLDQKKLEASRLVLGYAAAEDKPLVVDPVGCGASSFRLRAVQELLEIPWKGIIKGNRSEIYSIQQEELTREGIDSLENRRLTDRIHPGSIYLVTGEPDCILWGKGRVEVSHKGNLRQNVVGSGCLTGAVAGACSSAVYIMGICRKEGKLASDMGDGLLPGMALAALSASLGMAFALEHAGRTEGYAAAKSALLDGLCMLSEECFLDWLEERLCAAMKVSEWLC